MSLVEEILSEIKLIKEAKFSPSLHLCRELEYLATKIETAIKNSAKSLLEQKEVKDDESNSTTNVSKAASKSKVSKVQDTTKSISDVDKSLSNVPNKENSSEEVKKDTFVKPSQYMSQASIKVTIEGEK